MERIRPRVRLAASVAATAAVLLVALAPLARADGDGSLFIRKVTSASGSSGLPTTLDVVWTGAPADLESAKLSENGTDVQVSTPRALKPSTGIVFVIDSGPGVDGSNVLTKVREKVVATVQAHPGVNYAVVQAGDKADTKLAFTTDAARVKTAVDAIGPTNSASVWAALALAGSLFEGSSLQPNVVVITGDNSAGLPTDRAVGGTALASRGVALWADLFTGAGLDPAPFDDLIARSGGVSRQTDSADQMPVLVDDSINAITTKQYQLTYNSSVAVGNPINLALTVGGQTAAADAIAGGGAIQGNALRPEIGSTAKALPFLDNQLTFFAALALTLIAIAGLAYAFTLAFVRDDLSNALSPYAESFSSVDDDEVESNLGSSALIKRAVALTEQVAEQQGLLTRAEASLERANLPLRAAEALFVYLIIVIVATIVPLVLWRNLAPALVFGILGVLVPPAVINFLGKRRRKAFMAQLPDTLSLLSGTLRAGYSLMQGVEAVSQEVSEPMGLELRRVVTESRLGRPLEESLDASAERMDSPDFGWAVMAIRIQREVGGNLSELLMTVADTMIARERLRRDVAALTAEGRVSAVILGGLPPALAAIMYVLNPDYVSTLFKEGLGIGMIIAAVVSMAIGFLWMRKIINIEI